MPEALSPSSRLRLLLTVGQEPFSEELQLRLDAWVRAGGAWISVGGWPVFTRNALAAVPPHIKVVAFDTIPPAPEILKAGKVQLLIGQKYFGWGSESVRLLSGIKAGKMPASPIIDSGVDVVTAANVDQYVAQWKQLEKGKP